MMVEGSFPFQKGENVIGLPCWYIVKACSGMWFIIYLFQYMVIFMFLATFFKRQTCTSITLNEVNFKHKNPR